MGLYVGGTSLLLHGNGADGSTVFTDETGKTVTPYGNARISTAQSKFGGSSMYFDGVGDYVTVPGVVGFGSENFTIEAWVYLPNTPSGNYAAVLDTRTSGGGGGSVLFGVNSSRQLVYYRSSSTSNTSGTVPLNQWVHIAACRTQGVLSLFIDGLKSANIADAEDKLATSATYVGRVYDDMNPAFNGYIEDLRVTKGIALYTADFTPPTAPLEIVNPIQVQIQAHDSGITKLAKYDPSQVKPVISEVKDDLQDRWPYGPYKTPAVQFEFKGRGVITGTVFEKALPANTPLRRLVRLHREPDGAFVRATWSDDAGNYTFNGVRADHTFFITSFDYTNTYRAVIADRITPELIA